MQTSTNTLNVNAPPVTFVKIRANRSRKGLALWLADERVGTFVVAQQGRSPGKGELWQMRMLHEHDEKVAGGSAQMPIMPATRARHSIDDEMPHSGVMTGREVQAAWDQMKARKADHERRQARKRTRPRLFEWSEPEWQSSNSSV